MRTAAKHEFSNDQKQLLEKAKFWEYITIAYLAVMVFLMYKVMGNSQAMKTAWAEDILSLIPPLVFLLASKFRDKKPTAHFPYGYHRVTTLGFFIASLALLSVGLFLLYDSVLKLILVEHPTIGMKEFFGVDIWLGWWMILVNLLGVFPPVILGRIKLKFAEPLNDKILYTDADMGKADWMTATATIVGIFGIGIGLWWADSAAAIFVSFSIFKDGLTQTKDSFSELLNRHPKNLKGKYIDLPDRILDTAMQQDWIEQAEVRMREEGHIVWAEVFVKLAEKTSIDPARISDLQKQLQQIDWKLHEVLVTIES